MDNERIFIITQSVIAIVIVVGGGAFFFLRPEQDSSAIVGIVGMVIGWYFRSAAGNQIQSQRMREGGGSL